MKKSMPFLLLSVFGVLLTGRLLLAGTGYLDDTDEMLYLHIVKNYDALYRFDVEPWVRAMFDMQAQPPEIVIRLLESVVAKIYSSFTGVPMTHPNTLLVMGLCNIGVSLAILWFFFRILRLLDFSETSSVLGVLLLGTLANMNLYTRHLLPYDTALLFQLIALYILLKHGTGNRQVLWAGLLAAIGSTNYFGTFMFPVIVSGWLLWKDIQHSPKTAIRQLLLFLLPFLCLTLFYEMLTLALRGESYFRFLAFYTGTITQGSFHEGLAYVFIYFDLVEKKWGLFLLLLFFAGIVPAYRHAARPTVYRLVLLAIVAYLLYGTYVYVMEKMVFFGRVLHMYYPFIIIGALAGVEQLKPRMRNAVAVVLGAGALLYYAGMLAEYRQIGYPRNAIYTQGLYPGADSSFKYVEELEAFIDYENRSRWMVDSSGQSAPLAGNYTLQNFCFFIHHPDSFMLSYVPYVPEAGSQVVYDRLHFQSHPFYTLEYCSADGRRFFIEKKLRLRVIRQTD